MDNFDAFIDDLIANEKPIPVRESKPFVAPKKAYRRAAPVRRSAQELRDMRRASFDEQNPGLYDFLRSAGEWSDFAGSLADQLDTKGSLSERQWTSAQSMRAKMEARQAAKESNSVKVDLSRIVEMFNTAHESGYKKPLYRANGLRLKPGKGGAIYVLNEEREVMGTFGMQPAYEGKILNGQYMPTNAADVANSDKLVAIAADPRGVAISHGQRTGRCSCCGRELTKHASIEAGIGPICAEKWGF